MLLIGLKKTVLRPQNCQKVIFRIFAYFEYYARHQKNIIQRRKHPNKLENGVECAQNLTFCSKGPKYANFAYARNEKKILPLENFIVVLNPAL